MEYSKLEQFLSQPRLNRYLIATGQSKAKAQRLYKINIRVSQAFHPIFNLFETILRNAIDQQLGLYFGNKNWIIQEKTGFMSASSLSKSRYYLRTCVQKAESTLGKRHRYVTSARIVSEQMFGFWTSLFENQHYSLINGTVIRCFPHKSTHINRGAISKKLNRVRKFRNRIYHNEPICFRGNTIDFTLAMQIRDEIFDLLRWIDADLETYVRYFDNVDSKVNSANHL